MFSQYGITNFFSALSHLLTYSNMFHSFQGYCRLALSMKEVDAVTVNPQREGVYKYEKSFAVVAEGDTPTFNFLKRLTSVTTNTFNGVALTVIWISVTSKETL